MVKYCTWCLKAFLLKECVFYLCTVNADMLAPRLHICHSWAESCPRELIFLPQRNSIRIFIYKVKQPLAMRVFVKGKKRHSTYWHSFIKRGENKMLMDTRLWWGFMMLTALWLISSLPMWRWWCWMLDVGYAFLFPSLFERFLMALLTFPLHLSPRACRLRGPRAPFECPSPWPSVRQAAPARWSGRLTSSSWSAASV